MLLILITTLIITALAQAPARGPSGLPACCSDGCGTNGWVGWTTPQQFCPTACGYCLAGGAGRPAAAPGGAGGGAAPARGPSGLPACCRDGCGTNGWIGWSTPAQFCPIACGYCFGRPAIGAGAGAVAGAGAAGAGAGGGAAALCQQCQQALACYQADACTLYNPGTQQWAAPADACNDGAAQCAQCFPQSPCLTGGAGGGAGAAGAGAGGAGAGAGAGPQTADLCQQCTQAAQCFEDAACGLYDGTQWTGPADACNGGAAQCAPCFPQSTCAAQIAGGAGAPPAGGAPTGGQPTGGAPTGGQPTGGAPTGGQPTGGAPPADLCAQCQQAAQCFDAGCGLFDGTQWTGPAADCNQGAAQCAVCFPDSSCAAQVAAANGGAPPTGGQPTGGQPTGGQPNGGQPTGGAPTGGQPTGGAPPADLCAQCQQAAQCFDAGCGLFDGTQWTGPAADCNQGAAQCAVCFPDSSCAAQVAAANGGAPPTGGQPTGGQPTGVQPTGGAPTGGQPTGGAPTGGQPTGGAPPADLCAQCQQAAQCFDAGCGLFDGTQWTGPAADCNQGAAQCAVCFPDSQCAAQVAAANGGAPPSGAGSGAGGQPTGGQPTGGQPTGGQPTGGQPTGGQPTGGAPTGGQPTGGAPPADLCTQCQQAALCFEAGCGLFDGTQWTGPAADCNQGAAQCAVCFPDSQCAAQVAAANGGAPPTGGQPTGGQPTGGQPTGVQPTGRQPGSAICNNPADLNPTATFTDPNTGNTNTCGEADAFCGANVGACGDEAVNKQFFAAATTCCSGPGGGAPPQPAGRSSYICNSAADLVPTATFTDPLTGLTQACGDADSFCIANPGQCPDETQSKAFFAQNTPCCGGPGGAQRPGNGGCQDDPNWVDPTGQYTCATTPVAACTMPEYSSALQAVCPKKCGLCQGGVRTGPPAQQGPNPFANSPNGSVGQVPYTGQVPYGGQGYGGYDDYDYYPGGYDGAQGPQGQGCGDNPEWAYTDPISGVTYSCASIPASSCNLPEFEDVLKNQCQALCGLCGSSSGMAMDGMLMFIAVGVLAAVLLGIVLYFLCSKNEQQPAPAAYGRMEAPTARGRNVSWERDESHMLPPRKKRNKRRMMTQESDFV